MKTEMNDRINAFAAGTMTPAETEEFERLMRTDESLRREAEECLAAVEAAREWLGAEAPGAERVEGLEIPLLGSGEGERQPRRRTARIVRIQTYLTRAAAVAAIFMGGVLVGAMAPQLNPPPAEQTNAAVITPDPEPFPDQREVTIRTTWRPSQAAYAFASVPAADERRETSSEPSLSNITETDDGAVIIENYSESSRTESIWKVGGSIQMGNS